MAERDIAVVGIDVGGTFTDFFAVIDGQIRVHKLSTTPTDQSQAILEGLAALGVQQALIVHGMTVATNALLEQRGAKTALLTTAGFADVLLIGRQQRPHLYRLSQQRPPPLVADGLRLEANERLDANGAVMTPLDDGQITQVAHQLRTAGVESLAVVFLFAFRNPTHEQRAAALLQSLLPNLPISLSSEILPEYREYERTATTVINAYVQPLVARYMNQLYNALNGLATVRILQSNGGAIGLHQAARQAARLVLSGPAGGVVGAFEVARQATKSPVLNLLTLDMGGTSTDVALCPGEIPTTPESVIADLPLRLPVIDIHTVGAGGGSIAHLDAAGGLRVGPRSAGAIPGPVCYGRGGGEPTVTDANVVLGRLDPKGFLGGRGDVTLDVAAAQQALAALGRPLGLSAEAAALGVVRVVNAVMERALRRVSVERGYDPRQFVLTPFGGAGPLHACDLAEALGIRNILIPLYPGVLSAYGMLVAEVISDAAQSVLQPLAALNEDITPLRKTYASLAERVLAVLREDGVTEPTLAAALDLRYYGQSYELTVPVAAPLDSGALRRALLHLHEMHEQRYGYAIPDGAVEVVTLRVRGRAPGANPLLPVEALGDADAAGAIVDRKAVWYTETAATLTPCYDRERLRAGHRFAGPALVYQFDATTVIMPGWAVEVDEFRNLRLTRS